MACMAKAKGVRVTGAVNSVSLPDPEDLPQVIAEIDQRIEGHILYLPAGSATGGQIADISGVDVETGDEGKAGAPPAASFR